MILLFLAHKSIRSNSRAFLFSFQTQFLLSNPCVNLILLSIRTIPASSPPLFIIVPRTIRGAFGHRDLAICAHRQSARLYIPGFSVLTSELTLPYPNLLIPVCDAEITSNRYVAAQSHHKMSRTGPMAGKLSSIDMSKSLEAALYLHKTKMQTLTLSTLKSRIDLHVCGIVCKTK